MCAWTTTRDDSPTASRRSRGCFPRAANYQVIYVTGYVEYATPVYETPHVYFLLKPVQAEQLDAALGKALERLASQTGAYLPVTCGGAVAAASVGRIIYLETTVAR